ncbi:macrophage migration inhibitory factor homolog [Parasteatoda tepidariorum]|uniref:macrophage migration inhibitory factor homolog n=1 Tax=Parasteatoda tepidariorum TaxID=114398 RepID=UPI00077FA544|nr:macrophage migration inhibitory factor homolog [Parasteatoda tepidariorum]
MPILTIQTNVPKSEIPEDFLKVTASLVAEILRKPLSYVLVQINPDQLLSWGGGTGRCGHAELNSIGNLGKEENIALSKQLFSHFEKTLKIPSDKMYIKFEDLKKENVGYAGTTFAGM